MTIPYTREVPFEIYFSNIFLGTGLESSAPLSDGCVLWAGSSDLIGPSRGGMNVYNFLALSGANLKGNRIEGYTTQGFQMVFNELIFPEEFDGKSWLGKIRELDGKISSLSVLGDFDEEIEELRVSKNLQGYFPRKLHVQNARMVEVYSESSQEAEEFRSLFA